jgi:hypothetical protein
MWCIFAESNSRLCSVMSGWMTYEALQSRHSENLCTHFHSRRFWDITPCSPVKVNRRFGRTCRLHLQGRTVSHASNQHEAGSRLNFTGLHGVTCQKIELFIATAVRRSYPTCSLSSHVQWARMIFIQYKLQPRHHKFILGPQPEPLTFTSNIHILFSHFTSELSSRSFLGCLSDFTNLSQSV